MKKKLIKFLLPLAVLFACLGFAACGQDDLPEALDAPQNLKITNGTLAWDAVEYADGYTVGFHGEEIRTADCSFDLSQLEDGQYYPITVAAYSDRGIARSAGAEIEYREKCLAYTEGMDFKRIDAGICKATKLAVDQNGVCVLPAFYQGRRVVEFPTSTRDDADFVKVGEKIKTLSLPYCIKDSALKNLAQTCRYFPNLERITLGKGNEKYFSDGGCLIEREKNEVVLGGTESRIPVYATAIGAWAFSYRNLKSFTVPDTVTKIGNSAFAYCTSLQSVVLPDSVEMIDGGVFKGCTALKKAVLPERVSEFASDFAFYRCASLTEVNLPVGTQSLNATFVGCTALTDLTIPAGVKELRGAFEECSSLKNLTINEGIETIGNYSTILDVYMLFEGCDSLTEISLPSSLITVGDYAFYNSAVKSVTVPENVTSIGSWAFAKCASLTEVKLPQGLLEIESCAFANCSKLSAIDIPDSVITFSYDAFKSCTSLQKIVLPKSLNPFKTAFENCPLAEFYYKGTEGEWNEWLASATKSNQEYFSAATRYYYSESEPALNEAGTAYEGNYWRYVNGIPTRW